MIRRPPRSTRTDTLFPDTTLFRSADLVGSRRQVTLYLVVPPSDINRTKPLIRLILNQIGRRLTEELTLSGKRHRLLMMLDEFPALGRLDFFESALRSEERRVGKECVSTCRSRW